MEEKEISLLDILVFFKKYYKMIFSIGFGLSLVIGIFTYFFVPKQFESKATVMPISSGNSGGLSSMLANSALSGLVSLPSGNSGNVDIVPILKSSRFYDALNKQYDLMLSFKIRVIDDYYALMQSTLRVDKDLKSGLISVSYRSKDSDLNYRIVSYSLEYAKNFLQNNSMTSESMNRKFIEGRIKEVKPALEMAEKRLAMFQGKNKVIVPDEQGKNLVEAYSNFTAQKERLIIEQKSIEARLVELRDKGKKAIDAFGTDLSGKIDTAIAQNREELVKKKVDLELARQKYSDSHEKVVLLKKEVELLENQLQKQVSTAYKSIDENLDPNLIELEAARLSNLASQRAFDSMIEQYDEKIAKMPGVALEYARLVREEKVQETVYMMLIQEYERSKIQEKKEGRYFIVLDEPFASQRKVSPKTKLNIVIAFVLGSFMGIIIAVILETVKNLGIQNKYLLRIEKFIAR